MTTVQAHWLLVGRIPCVEITTATAGHNQSAACDETYVTDADLS
jgi:hypothetical protein